MASVLDGLDQIFNSALATMFYPATLLRDTDSGTLTYSCLALVEQYRKDMRGGDAGSVVNAVERRVMITGASLATSPQANDRVSVSGGISGVHTLTEDIIIDPARAVWVCRSRM